MSLVRLLVDHFVDDYAQAMVDREHERMFGEQLPRPWARRYCRNPLCISCRPYRRSAKLELEARRRRLSVAFAPPVVFTVDDVHAVASASAASSRLELDKHDAEISASYERAQLRSHARAGDR